MRDVELGLITDTVSDLSPQMAQEMATGLVPIYVRMAGARYKDWQELAPDVLDQAMRQGEEPVTEPPAVEHKHCPQRLRRGG